MGVDIQIEGVSYIAGRNAYGSWLVEFPSVNVDEDLALQQSQATFTVRIRGTYAGNGVWNWPIGRPKAGQEVTMINNAGVREFGGILLTPSEKEVAPGEMIFTCTCGDYTKWFDRILVNATYQSGVTLQAFVNDLVSQYVNTAGNSRTFTTNNVQQSPSIPLPILQFVYIPPSQVMGQLTQMLGWGFFIDEYRDVNFFSTETNISPLPNNTLDADYLWNNPSLVSETPNWTDIEILEDASQIKNRVYITGIYIASQIEYTESFVADGQQALYTLGYQPPNDVAKITVSVNGTFYQIARDLIDATPGGPCDPQTAYVNFSQQTVRFCSAPVSGAKIVVNYYPMQQSAVVLQDATAQKELASIDGTDGIREFNRLDPSLSAELPTLAQQRAQMTLTKYAYPHIKGSFRSFLPGWRRGQYFIFRSKRRMQGDYDGKQLFITHVKKTLVRMNGAEWFWMYTINFSNTPFEY